jgi:hypothetical protein
MLLALLRGVEHRKTQVCSTARAAAAAAATYTAETSIVLECACVTDRG